MKKILCLVGMPGSGKSTVANYLLQKSNYKYIRFGQIILDKVKETGQPPTEKLEREIREAIRRDHGMAAVAILNIPKIEDALETSDVLVDGLRSFEEFLFLKEKYGDQVVIIAVFASPWIRYDRLSNRGDRHGKDEDLKFRSFTKNESYSRDIAELENLNMGNSIALADFTIINNSDEENVKKQVDDILLNIYS